MTGKEGLYTEVQADQIFSLTRWLERFRRTGKVIVPQVFQPVVLVLRNLDDTNTGTTLFANADANGRLLIGATDAIPLPVKPGGTIYGFDATWQQANVAGGAIIVDIAFGSMAQLLNLRAVNSGTNGFSLYMTAAGGAGAATAGYVASAAATNVNLPSTGSSAGSSGNLINSVGLIMAGSDVLAVQQLVAGAQNDTLRIIARFLFYGTSPTLPTFSVARSTNAANVSVTVGDATFTAVA